MLRLHEVSARYGPIRVCQGIGFAVERGELLVLLGANGAGKSSTLGAIAGLVRSGGEIELDGRALQRLSAHERAWAGLAFVPEGRRNLMQGLSVDENLQLGARLLPPSERAAMRDELKAQFPVLQRRQAQLASALSGGEQQLLALAVAIARRPTVLLLDEPSQGLDPLALDRLADAIAGLRGRGMAIVLAEQNHRFAARLGDRFVALRGGSVVGRGDRAELANAEATAAAMFG